MSLLHRAAGRQYGHVTRRQLLTFGFSGESIDRRIRDGTLIPVHAGVYAVGVLRHDGPARAAAAVLACGEGALLSHAAAAALWGFRPWPRRIDVTVPRERRRPGIATHRCATITSADRRTHQGIRTTSPARTVLDIAPALSDRQLTRAVNDARHGANLRLEHLADLVRRCPTHRGARRVKRFVAQPTGPTRSDFEDAFLAFTERYGLPRPQFAVQLGPYEVDALFPQQRLIVELDSWQFHQDREAFITDRERDAAHLANGFRTLRITWERLMDAPEKEARRLRRILAS